MECIGVSLDTLTLLLCNVMFLRVVTTWQWMCFSSAPSCFLSSHVSLGLTSCLSNKVDLEPLWILIPSAGSRRAVGVHFSLSDDVCPNSTTNMDFIDWRENKRADDDCQA